ncbi:MAG TPA: leucyl aminopeptidase family protein [Burkholderiales bacterium]|jgi:leucyl aminopeptidase|nr:leucyl aminopeptidase family protein [Burkholderiales bacterium]
MLAKLEQSPALLTAPEARRASHLLLVLPKTKDAGALSGLPFAGSLNAALKRRQKKIDELAKGPLAADLPHGALAAWMMLDADQSPFEQQTVVRKGLQLLLAEKPKEIAIAVFGDAKARRRAAELAVYAAWVNGTTLPERKKKAESTSLARIRVYGYRAADGFALLRAQAIGNTLCRELTVLPPNELTPGTYRQRIAKLARDYRWAREEYDLKRLRRMKAGAFVAVAQGSAEEDAAIVHLRYRHKQAKKTLALVGKGICFDTGGHNLKTARYMHGMHEDMNGSAVALGILLAATEARLPVNLDCWLAIAQNHLSPRAYKQNEVITALNGTTIEIVHTDAEGRMVLADTLTLAARAKPDVMVDFATLTGSMHIALGDRYSGIFATRDEWAQRALAAGIASGERVWRFPLDEDYDAALESTIADVKQCTLEGEADHILGARLLKRFTDDRPWIHMDLSGSNCKGGLGAVATDVTGFGVGWGTHLLESWIGR